MCMFGYFASKLNMFEAKICLRQPDISRQKWSLGVEAGVAQRLPCVPKGSAGISYPALDGNKILSSYTEDTYIVEEEETGT